MARTRMGAALLTLALSGASVSMACNANTQDEARQDAREAIGTTGERAREMANEAGERTADLAEDARKAIQEGTISSKIKAKMALDDLVKASEVSVETEGAIVTVSGTVDTAAQRDRVLQLARETDGVADVVDRLQVRR